jgi:hypothetical protein
MKLLRAVIAAVAIPILILILFAVSTVLATPPQGKTTLCHVTGNGSAHEITVSNSAVPAHLNHGDTPLDEYGECQ